MIFILSIIICWLLLMRLCSVFMVFASIVSFRRWSLSKSEASEGGMASKKGATDIFLNHGVCLKMTLSGSQAKNEYVFCFLEGKKRCRE